MSSDDLPPGATLLPRRQVAPAPDEPPPGATIIPDKYRAAAKAEMDKLYPPTRGLSDLVKGTSGASPGPGALSDYTRRLTQGVGMNWTDEAVAGMMTPLEMIKRGVGPSEGYNYAKARENLLTEGAKERTGTTGSAVEMLGGLATGGRAVLGGLPQAGVTAIKQAPGAWNAVGRYFGNTGKAGIMGGVAGAGEGDTWSGRAVGAGTGGVIGSIFGAAAPAVISGAKWAAQPLKRFLPSSPTAPIPNVEDVATDQIANVMRRSGKTRQQVLQEVADANASGQPYILAEGIGTEGQRKLAGIAKSPGAARQWIDEDLGVRDVGRNLRVREATDTGLGMPPGHTAEEASQALTQRARQESRPLYNAANEVQPVWSPRMQEFFDHPEYQRALQAGFHVERTRALAEGRPFNPSDYAITHFNEAGDPLMAAVPNMRTIDLMKKGVDVILNNPKYKNPLTGRLDTSDPYVNALQRSQQAMLREVDSLNPTYGQARAAYAGPAQVRGAVERGRNIPTAGRPEDTIRRFEASTPNEQVGTRIGIADKIATDLSKGTETGPLPAYLRNQKGQQELDWMSLHQGPRQPMPQNPMARASDPVQFQPDPMRRAINREQIMRKTYTDARKGSSTAENLADMADNVPEADVVGVASNLLSGNLIGAVKAVVPGAGRIGRGETEAQRTAMARILMERDPQELAAIMQRIDDLAARRTAGATSRAGAAGAGGSEVMAPDEARRIRRLYIDTPRRN